MTAHNRQNHSPASGQGWLLRLALLTPALLLSALAMGLGGALIVGGLRHGLGANDKPASGESPSDAIGSAEAAPPSAALAAGDAPQTLDKGALISRGEKIYNTSCVACHQPTGLGLPTVFPPLAGSDWVCSEDADCAVAVVLIGLQGPITVNGKPFNTMMAMPPHGAMLDDPGVAAVLTYVRNAWRNQGPPVDPKRVGELRTRFKDRGTMWTQQELQGAIHGGKIPDSHHVHPSPAK